MKYPALNYSVTLEALTKFFRSLENHQDLKIPLEAYELPGENSQAAENLAKYLLMGCPTSDLSQAMHSKMSEVKGIMGDDFISPAEVALMRKMPYTEKQLYYFLATLPSYPDLERLAADNFVLFPGPPRPMSWFEIGKMNPELFKRTKSHPRYFDFPENDSSPDEKVMPEWFVISKSWAS